MSPVRAFIALELPDAVRESLAALIERARADAPGKLGWVAAEKLHLTLAFLGACAPERLDALGVELRRALASQPSLPLALGQPGLFPGPSRPQVLWIGVEGGGALPQLRERVVVACAAAGLPLDRKPFVPHLTCARVRAPGARDALARHWLGQPVRAQPWTQEAVSVMRSDPSPRGAVYSAVERISLRG